MTYIVRGKGLGAKSMPIAAEIANLPVYKSGESLPDSAEYVFRWGTTVIVPGGKIVNKSSAIGTTSDKRAFRLLLAKNGLSMKSWGTLDEYITDGSYKEEKELMIRPEFHSRSESMYHCKTLADALAATKKVGSRYYISEFVQKKNEYRIFIAQNRVVWMIKKHPKSASDLTWGCVEEGNFEYIGWTEWNKNVVDVGLRSMKLSGLDFGAVDIVEDQNGNFYVLEVNTAPWLSPYYAKCVGKVFKYIVQNGRDHFEDPENLSWKNTIHPAIGS